MKFKEYLLSAGGKEFPRVDNENDLHDLTGVLVGQFNVDPGLAIDPDPTLSVTDS